MQTVGSHTSRRLPGACLPTGCQSHISVAHELFSQAGMNAEECYKVLRGNAITCYGLERFGIEE